MPYAFSAVLLPADMAGMNCMGLVPAVQAWTGF